MSEHQTLLRYAQRLPELLEQLYRTPTDIGEWNGMLNRLVEATSSRSARLLVMDRQAATVHYSTKVNIDDDQHRRYVDHFVNLCPWRPELALKTPGRLYNTHHEFACKQDAFYQTEFFNDWARHLDIEHGLCGTVYTDDRYTVQLLVQRTGGQGAFPMSLTRQVNQLIPHVRQVLHLNRVMTMQQQESVSALAAAEKTFVPFLLVNGRGQVVYGSGRALELVDRSPVLRVEDGALRLMDSKAQLQLRKSLDVVLSGPQRSAEQVIVLAADALSPLRLVVEPLPLALAAGGLWQGDLLAAVYLQAAEEHLDIDPDLLGRLFNLTAAEARVAASLALGRDPAAIAGEATVSLHTVRTQLKAVMHKMRVGRQAELVARVLRSAAVRVSG
ncbi:helix-turn-helix transcriptional regulator, partial [uncultured Marinobacter sp.]|uniref:helix-turn-helix transcriptional regulator n=1 Tax=uncultured Marinobacter sp. TaxID=187379 RepID=UPI0030D958CB